MYIRKMRICEEGKDERVPISDELKAIASEIRKQLKDVGVEGCITVESSSAIKVVECRLTREYIKEYGYNQSPFSERHMAILGWEDWLVVNNTVNGIIDSFHVSAHATSLNNSITVRDGIDYDQQYRNAEYTRGNGYHYYNREEAWESCGRGRDGWREDRKNVKFFTDNKEILIEGISAEIKLDRDISQRDLDFIKFYGGNRSIFEKECSDKNTPQAMRTLARIQQIFQITMKKRGRSKAEPLEIML